ncbi:MAG TPA: Uma2 family endonuclease, partial [Gemmataceae bacterium]|nr:Uma2 family endonuclease [Gemmataceae bacterium]
KRPAYREAGVKEIWFVDPENEQVIVDRLRGFSYVEKIIRRGKLRSTVLKGFWIDVRWLWSDPMPAVGDCLHEIMGGK